MAFVIGAAFAAIVTSFVNDILLQLVAAIFGTADFSALAIDVNGTPIRIGAFLNAVISFLTVAAAVFFFVVKPMNALLARRAKGDEPAPDPTNEERLLGEIRDLLASRPA